MKKQGEENTDLDISCGKVEMSPDAEGMRRAGESLPRVHRACLGHTYIPVCGAHGQLETAKGNRVKKGIMAQLSQCMYSWYSRKASSTQGFLKTSYLVSVTALEGRSD